MDDVTFAGTVVEQNRPMGAALRCPISTQSLIHGGCPTIPYAEASKTNSTALFWSSSSMFHSQSMLVKYASGQLGVVKVPLSPISVPPHSRFGKDSSKWLGQKTRHNYMGLISIGHGKVVV